MCTGKGRNERRIRDILTIGEKSEFRNQEEKKVSEKHNG